MFKIKNVYLEKLFLFGLVVIFCTTVVYAKKIQITARIPGLNNAPEIVSIVPDFSPIVLERNTIQSFSLQIKDVEGDSITYTITPEEGTVSSDNGLVQDSQKLQNAQVFINFSYLSDSTHLGNGRIIFTINDGQGNLVTEEISIYTF